MLTNEQHTQLAEQLLEAAETKVAVQRASARYPEMTIEDSYAVQSIWAQRKLDAGARLIGHKIGLTSHVMQQAVGIDEPDYGVVFEEHLHESGSVIEFDRFATVRVETELAFVLSKPLTGTHTTVFDVLDATAYVVPALEILDARFEMEGRTIVDNIADNAALGAMVLGNTALRPDQFDLANEGAVIYRNEKIEDSGVSAAVLGNPALSVAWLANKLGAHGQSLDAGEIILSGSFTKPMWIERGDVVFAQYQNLGTVTCRFS